MAIQSLAKLCRKCGLWLPLARFPFRKAEQTYRGTCKACRAVESKALRHSPEHAGRIRQQERKRSAARRAQRRQPVPMVLGKHSTARGPEGRGG